MADHAQELRPRPFHLLNRRQVLNRHHSRLDRDGRRRAADLAWLRRRADRGDVDECGQAASVRSLQHDLVGAHRLIDAEHVGQAELAQRDFVPVATAYGQGGDDLLRGPRVARRGRLLGNAQHVGDPPPLAVEGCRRAAGQIEDDHAHRGGVDQRLEISAGAQLVAVAASVGDHQRYLRGEQHQRLFILARERLPRPALGHVDRPDRDALGTNRHSKKGADRRGRQELGQPHGRDVSGEVVHSQRSGNPAQIGEETRTFRHPPERFALLRRQTGDEEILDLTRLVQRRDQRVSRLRQGPRAVQHAVQHRVEVQALVNPQARLRQARQALLQIAYLLVAVVVLGHWSTSLLQICLEWRTPQKGKPSANVTEMLANLPLGHQR